MDFLKNVKADLFGWYDSLPRLIQIIVTLTTLCVFTPTALALGIVSGTAMFFGIGFFVFISTIICIAGFCLDFCVGVYNFIMLMKEFYEYLFPSKVRQLPDFANQAPPRAPTSNGKRSNPSRGARNSRNSTGSRNSTQPKSETSAVEVRKEVENENEQVNKNEDEFEADNVNDEIKFEDKDEIEEIEDTKENEEEDEGEDEDEEIEDTEVNEDEEETEDESEDEDEEFEVEEEEEDEDYSQVFTEDTSLLTNTYEFCELLGSGCFSMVFRCIRKSTGQHFACKFLSKMNKIVTPELVRDEVELMKRARDLDGVVHFHEGFEDKDGYYIILDYCGRGSIRNLLEERKGLGIFSLKSIMNQLSHGLFNLHSKDILHLDIKDDNVLFTHSFKEDGFWNCKLVDLGIGRVLQEDHMVEGGQGGGSPFYMSPERCSKEGYYGKPADVWSLGVLMYVMIFRCYPYDAETREEVLELILTQPLALSIPSEQEVYVQAVDLLKRMLEIDQFKRITAKEMLSHPFIKAASSTPAGPPGFGALRTSPRDGSVFSPHSPPPGFHNRGAQA